MLSETGWGQVGLVAVTGGLNLGCVLWMALPPGGLVTASCGPECPEAKSYRVLASFLAAQGMPSTPCFHVRSSGQPSLMGQPLLSLTRGTNAVPPVGQTEGLLYTLPLHAVRRD